MFVQYSFYPKQKIVTFRIFFIDFIIFPNAFKVSFAVPLFESNHNIIPLFMLCLRSSNKCLLHLFCEPIATSSSKGPMWLHALKVPDLSFSQYLTYCYSGQYFFFVCWDLSDYPLVFFALMEFLPSSLMVEEKFGTGKLTLFELKTFICGQLIY